MALGLYASQAVYYISSEKSQRVTQLVGVAKKGLWLYCMALGLYKYSPYSPRGQVWVKKAGA